jgi:uncharacterized membrane protein YphA (DoxX/SURF4 family)
MHPVLLAGIRVAVAAVWIYEGLWLKVLRPAPHELALVESLPFRALSPSQILLGIGVGETLLGLGVLSGWHARLLAWFQGVLLVLMNGIGIALGGGAVADPVGLVIHNLPLLLCIIALGVHGPRSAVPQRGEKP